MEGTSREYMPIAFPAVPDFSLLQHLAAAAEALQYTYQIGVVQCKDSFYGQHDPERMPVKQELLSNWAAWKAGVVLASEMESAALFIVASTLHVRCVVCNCSGSACSMCNGIAYDLESGTGGSFGRNCPA